MSCSIAGQSPYICNIHTVCRSSETQLCSLYRIGGGVGLRRFRCMYYSFVFQDHRRGFVHRCVWKRVGWGFQWQASERTCSQDILTAQHFLSMFFCVVCDMFCTVCTIANVSSFTWTVEPLYSGHLETRKLS